MHAIPWPELLGSDFERVVGERGLTDGERETLTRVLNIRDGYATEFLGRYDRMVALLPPWASSGEVSDVIFRQTLEGLNEMKVKLRLPILEQERSQLLLEVLDELMALMGKRLAQRVFPPLLAEFLADL